MYRRTPEASKEDAQPARPLADRPVSTQIRFPMAGEAQVQMIVFLSALRMPPKPTKRVDHPLAPAPARWAAGVSPRYAMRAQVAPKSSCVASTQPGAFEPCVRVCLCLSHIPSQRVERGMFSGRYRDIYRPDGPPTTPTHAFQVDSSLDLFVISTSRCPSTPYFWDVLHEHPSIRPLDSAFARQRVARPT